MPKINSETKAALRRDLGELLAKHGRAYQYSHLHRRYPEVGKASFYKILRQVEATGIPAVKARSNIKMAVAKDAAVLGSREAVVNRDVVKISEQLPAPIEPGELIGLNLVQIVGKLQDCVAAADRMKAHAMTDDGKMRNPRLFLNASEHLRKTLETASKLAERIWDIQQVKKLMDAVFTELRAESPELVRRILLRLTALNDFSGVSLGE